MMMVHYSRGIYTHTHTHTHAHIHIRTHKHSMHSFMHIKQDIYIYVFKRCQTEFI